MRNTLTEWASAHGIPDAAMQDLFSRLLRESLPQQYPTAPGSEAKVQQDVRFSAPARGELLWRNNVGVAVDETGRTIRYGLCNDSKQINERFKSSDLIGLRRVVITPEMVGRVIGQFVARECKPSDWRYGGTPREVAQQAWINLVNGYGGDACFTTGIDAPVNTRVS